MSVPRWAQWSKKVRARQNMTVPMARGHGLKKGLVIGELDISRGWNLVSTADPIWITNFGPITWPAEVGPGDGSCSYFFPSCSVAPNGSTSLRSLFSTAPAHTRLTVTVFKIISTLRLFLAWGEPFMVEIGWIQYGDVMFGDTRFWVINKKKSTFKQSNLSSLQRRLRGLHTGSVADYREWQKWNHQWDRKW